MRHHVIRHQLEPWFDPDVVFAALYATSDRAFWLDAGRAPATGFSYLGEGTRLVTASLATRSLSGTNDAEAAQGDIFEFLGEQQRAGVDSGGAGGFGLGWVGWFGYELRSTTMGMPSRPDARTSRYPDAAWLEDPTQNGNLAGAMRAGSSLAIELVSDKGVKVRETFSLAGATAASKAMSDNC